MCEMHKLVEQYVEKFNENFPIGYIRYLSEEELIEMIKNAIENNEKIIIAYDDEADY